MPRINACVIVHDRFQDTVMAELDNGTIVDLFCFYPDELHFTPEQFLGLTQDQALQVYMHADKMYLLS